MEDISTYRISVLGSVNEEEINAMSPLWMEMTRAETAATLFTTRADQSGLIGLMRHLHGRGFVILSVSRVNTDTRGPIGQK
ncbi:MAG: hypothetical protein ACM3ZC_03210 [Bacteroidota bacterium]